MHVYLRGKVYWCQFRIGGELVRLSTGKVDKSDAEKEARRLHVEKEQATPVRRRGVGSLELLQLWDIATRSAEHTSKASSKRVTDLWIPVLHYFGRLSDPIEVTSAAVYEYVKARKPVRNQTIRRELQALRRGLAEAKRRKWITDLPEPWPSLEKDPPHPKMRGKLHSEELIHAVMRELPPMAVDGVVFALATGLRLEELHRVRWSNVRGLPESDQQAAVAILHLPEGSTKTRKKRYLGLNRDAHDIAERRFKVFGDEVFPRYGYTQALKRTATALTRCTCGQIIRLKEHRCPHCLERAAAPRTPIVASMHMRDMRHTFASTALRVSGGNLSAVAKAMGHSELEITTLYLHAREEDVLNLAATVITPDRSQRVEGKKPGRVSAQELREKVVRDTGVEPVTFGFGGQTFRDNVGEINLTDPGKVQRILARLKAFDHSDRSQPATARMQPEYPRSQVQCETCGRSADVEDGPGIWECIFCGSGRVRVEL